MQKVLLGDEAIAQGAIDGGISGVYAYPGTPSTEITEYIQHNKTATERKIHRQWSTNEKTAMEAALGMSYAGKRSMACMKHVGLNVAADCFMNAAITGINGGLLIVVADDPGMHSSQNEQDSRYFGRFAQIPILEPSNQQEAYEMTHRGFEFSEQIGVPVLLRLTTRLAHSRAIVNLAATKNENKLHAPANSKQFILLPGIARKQYKSLIEKQNGFKQLSEESSFNKFTEGPDNKLGIVACGLAYNYLMENFPEGCTYAVVKVSQYPLPKKLIKKLKEQSDTLLVLEDGYPIIEEQLSDYFDNYPIKGKLDGTLPRVGELNPDIVAKALGLNKETEKPIPNIVAGRPPALCKGCSHHDVYTILNQVLEQQPSAHVFGDIGCYTIGALAPYTAINSCVDMGASITMAKGASDAGIFPAVAIIGDSTFTHSGITGLLDAVNEKSPITVIISDNEATAMTGGQDSAGEGKIESICKGIGIEPEHLRVILPHKKNYDEMIQVFEKELAYKGVSVIIPRRICIQKHVQNVKLKKK